MWLHKGTWRRYELSECHSSFYSLSAVGVWCHAVKPSISFNTVRVRARYWGKWQGMKWPVKSKKVRGDRFQNDSRKLVFYPICCSSCSSDVYLVSVWLSFVNVMHWCSFVSENQLYQYTMTPLHCVNIRPDACMCFHKSICPRTTEKEQPLSPC